MCCRYFLDESPELRPFVEAMNRAPLLSGMTGQLHKTAVTSGEVRPGDIVPALALSARSRTVSVYPMLWGWKQGTGLLINARLESAADKPTFRDSWQSRRCVLPAACYFEWSHFLSPEGKKRTGQKYRIGPSSGETCYLAGLYRFEGNAQIHYPVFTILTRSPSPVISSIHDRMPVLLAQQDVPDWLTGPADPERTYGMSLSDLYLTAAS